MYKLELLCVKYVPIIIAAIVLLNAILAHFDVYVAINAQYHDYCELFKAWFGDSVDSKIVESAINF